MDEGVYLVEDGHDGEVLGEEEFLKLDFCDWEEGGEDGVVFEGEDVDAVLLGQLNDLLSSVS